MRHYLVAALTLVAIQTGAEEPQVPKELQGYWVPAQASCKSDLGLLVTANSVEFRNKEERKRVKTEACYA